MTRFVYTAIPSQPGGGAVQGREEAHDERTLRERLRDKGLIVIDVRPVSAADALRARIGGRSERLRRRDRLWFFATLSRLLRSKSPLEPALDTMAQVAPSPAARRASETVRDALRSGVALHEAVERVPGVAEPGQVALLRVGHASGRLGHTVALVDAGARRREAIRRKIVGDLVYPAILVVTGVAMLWFLASFVVPRLTETLESAGATLPLATRVTMAASVWLVWGLPVLALLAAAGVAALRAGLAPPALGERLGVWSMRLPVVGSVLWHARAGVVTDTLATMIEGGGDLLAALELAEDAVGGGVVGQRLASARQAVREGADLGEAFDRFHVLPPMISAMVRIGARSGDLAGSLRGAAEACVETHETLVQRLLTLLQPAVILLLAGVVGWVVYSLIVGMLAVNESVAI